MNILLLGAGFTKNWNGPLARDVFNWLLSAPEVQADGELKQLLFQHQTSGGFENALAQMQANYLASPSAENRTRLDRFQAAINKVFADLDAGLAKIVDWEFSNQIGFRLTDFLIQFDAIFTLNQDLFLERFYMNDNVMLASNKRWNGCIIPGVRRISIPDDPRNVGAARWVPDMANIAVPPRFQPLYKLHGSYRWESETGDGLMVMGGNKSIAIRSNTLLTQYGKEFERHLAMGATRLVVIGYGFGDQHINNVILGAEARGLQVFIVDRDGVEAAHPQKGRLGLKMPNPFQNIIAGVSQEPLSQIFGGNQIEHARLLEFVKRR